MERQQILSLAEPLLASAAEDAGCHPFLIRLQVAFALLLFHVFSVVTGVPPVCAQSAADTAATTEEQSSCPYFRPLADPCRTDIFHTRFAQAAKFAKAGSAGTPYLQDILLMHDSGIFAVRR